MHSMIKFDYVTLMQYFEYSSSNKNSNKKLFLGVIKATEITTQYTLYFTLCNISLLLEFNIITITIDKNIFIIYIYIVFISFCAINTT